MIAPRAEVLATRTAEHGGRLALAPGAAVASPVRHDFSVCLNAYGPADVVSRAIADSRIDEYPDPRSHEARNAAANRWARPVGEIVFGAGAAELIHAVCFAYLRVGDPVIIGAPAFGEYERAAALCGAQIVMVDVPGTAAPIDGLCAEIARTHPRLVFLATPFSPTGGALSLGDVQRVADTCRAVDCLLVLDQAYDAFAAAALGTPALPGHSNVLHIRSMTKDHALAGVRVAFAVASPDVAAALERVRIPWAASAAAQAAGTALMTDDAIAHVTRTTGLLRAEAARIGTACTSRGLAVCSSTTHFFLIHCTDAAATRQRLLATSGILVRDCSSFGLPEWIRVAARTPAENDALIAALDETIS